MNEILFPSASENGFLYEFAAKKAFFDILFSKMYFYFVENKKINLKFVRIMQKRYPFLNLGNFIQKCFLNGVDKLLFSARENGCPKAVIDYNIKKFFSFEPFFIYEFLFNLYYKEASVFFNRLFSFHKIGEENKNMFEIYFDSGKFINVDSLGIANNLKFFSYVSILQKTEKIFKDEIINADYKNFLFKKREPLMGGEWFKSDFLIKITDLNTKKVKYINIDFGQFYSNIDFLKKIIFNVFEDSPNFYKFIKNLSKKDREKFKKNLSFFYNLHKISFIVSELKKTGDFAFLEADNIKQTYNEKDIFERAIRNKQNKRFLKSIITLGKPMLKIIQSGAYINSVLIKSAKKQEPYIFLKENEKFDGAYLYSLGSIYQKNYFINPKRKTEILSLMSQMYGEYVKMRKEEYFWNLFSLFKYNPYFKDIKFCFKNKKEEKKEKIFYAFYKTLAKNMLKENEKANLLLFTGNTLIKNSEFYGLNSDIRTKHYKIFKKFLKEKHPLIINCASPGTGKTTGVFKYCFEENKDFYYFTSRIQIMNSIYEDIKGGYKSFLNKYAKDEINENIKTKIKKVFNKIVYFTLDGSDVGLKVVRDGKEKEAVRVRYYLGEGVDEEKIKESIENTSVDENFVFIAERIDSKKHRDFFKKEYSEGVTEKRKRGTKKGKIRESGVGKALRNLYQKTIPEIRRTDEKILIVTGFTLQALEKSGINGQDILKAIISNGKSVTMFDEIFGSSQPKNLLKRIILNPNIVSELKEQEEKGSIFVIADANIKHEEMINFVLREYNNSSLSNKIVFFKNEEAKDIEIKKTKIESLEVPVILTNSFPAKNIYIKFISEFLPSEGNFRTINIFLKTISDEYEKIKNSNETIFVYIQNKEAINTVKKELINTLKINSNEIIEYHSDIENKTKPSKKTKIILATSSASRGLTFNRVRRFIVLFQNFNIVSGLGELSQVIYRGRGKGNDDDTDKYFTFIYQDYYERMDFVQNAEYVSSFKIYSMLTKFFMTLSVFSLFSGYKMRFEDKENKNFIRTGILPVPADSKERQISGFEILNIKKEYFKIMENSERNGWVKNMLKNNKIFCSSFETFCSYSKKFLSLFLNDNTALRAFENTREEKISEINDIFNNIILKFKIENADKTFELENIKDENEVKINIYIEKIKESVKLIKEISEHDKNADKSFIRKIDSILKEIISYENSRLSIITEDMQNGILSILINPVYLKQNYYKEENIFNNDIEHLKDSLGTKNFSKYFFSLYEKEINSNPFFEKMCNFYNRKADLLKNVSLFDYADKLYKRAYQNSYGITKESIITVNDINPQKTGALSLAFNIKPINYSKSFHLYSAYYIFYQ